MEKVKDQFQIEELYYLENLDQMEAFASRIRYRMVALLTGSPKTAAQLAREVGVSRPKAHYHLQVLVKVGLAEFVYEKLVNGIMEKYYLGRAHFYSFDKLSEHTVIHPEDIAFSRKMTQLQNDFLLNVLEISRERVVQNQTGDASAKNYYFDFGCRLTDEQTTQVFQQLDAISQTIRDFRAQNIKLPNYTDLPYYKTMLLIMPLLPQRDVVKKSNRA